MSQSRNLLLKPNKQRFMIKCPLRRDFIRYTFVGLFLLTCVCAHGQMSKLSPFVRRVVMERSSMSSPSKAASARASQKASLMAFVKATDMEILRSEGCSIHALWDDICIASIPLDKIKTLAQHKEVLRIEAGQSCNVQLDTTTTITRSRDLWSRPFNKAEGITGKGVVVGVMDIGFDLTHPTFFSQDGSRYRVKQLWDMLDYSEDGEAVTRPDTIFFGMMGVHLGRQYIGEEAILAHQHSADGLGLTHGTHTSGIAAGSGWNGTVLSPYIGTAPDADICLVANCTSDNSYLVPEYKRDYYTTATDMLGFKYIFDYAESMGQPCVINFSEGEAEDLYQSILYNKVLTQMTGPGRIICSTAGNDGNYLTYLPKPLGREQAGSFLTASSYTAGYTLHSTNPVKFKLTFYDRNSDDRKEWTFDPGSQREFPEEYTEEIVHFKDADFQILYEIYSSGFDETKYATDLFIIDERGKSIGKSDIEISITLYDARNDVEMRYAGGYFSTSNTNPSLCDARKGHCIRFPGSADEVVAVGASSHVDRKVNYKGELVDFEMSTDGARATYSGTGPTQKGNIKPDVMAPGNFIISSYNSFFLENHPDAPVFKYDIEHFEYNGRTYPWSADSGTSMACPVVTGIIAQWLQVCPTLTPAQVKDVFAHTCRHYDNTLTYPNNEYGYGEIDALAGLDYILSQYAGIENTTSATLSEATRYYTIEGIALPSIEGRRGVIIVKDRKGTRKIYR